MIRSVISDAERAVDWPSLLRSGGTLVTYATEIPHFPEASLLFEEELEQSKKQFTKAGFTERDGTPYAYAFVLPQDGPVVWRRVEIGSRMTFYLQDVAGKPLVSQFTLATVRVSVRSTK